MNYLHEVKVRETDNRCLHHILIVRPMVYYVLEGILTMFLQRRVTWFSADVTEQDKGTID